MAEPYLIIPLLNNALTTFELPVWFLSESIKVTQIKSEDYFALHRDADAIYIPILTAKTLCVYVERPGEPLDAFTRSLCTQLQFVLKTFSTEPIILSQAALIQENEQERRVLQSFELLNHSVADTLRQKAFSFRQGTTPEELYQWFTVVTKAVATSEPMNITLGRFNSSLTRTDPFDQIIDLTISMESLIQSSVELKFKFALFHSYVCADTPQERKTIFNILKVLYDARSSIVHGDSATRSAKTKIETAVQSLPELLRVAHKAISYHLLFLFDHEPKTWQEHLDGLVLGTEERLNI